MINLLEKIEMNALEKRLGAPKPFLSCELSSSNRHRLVVLSQSDLKVKG